MRRLTQPAKALPVLALTNGADLTLLPAPVLRRCSPCISGPMVRGSNCSLSEQLLPFGAIAPRKWANRPGPVRGVPGARGGGGGIFGGLGSCSRCSARNCSLLPDQSTISASKSRSLSAGSRFRSGLRSRGTGGPVRPGRSDWFRRSIPRGGSPDGSVRERGHAPATPGRQAWPPARRRRARWASGQRPEGGEAARPPGRSPTWRGAPARPRPRRRSPRPGPRCRRRPGAGRTWLPPPGALEPLRPPLPTLPPPAPLRRRDPHHAASVPAEVGALAGLRRGAEPAGATD